MATTKKQSSTKTSSKSLHTTVKSSGAKLQTMEDILAAYGGGQVRGYSVGDKVKGKVTAISKNRVVVDIGGKSEAIVAEKAYKEAENFIRTLKVGDEIDAAVIVPETSDGYTILSFRHAAGEATWKKIEKSYQDATPLRVEVRGVNPSGLVVDISGITGFVPNSQLGKELGKNLEALIGKRFEAIVITLDRASNKVVLSEKYVSEAEEMKLLDEAMEVVKKGEEYNGVVTTVYDFGCFVKFEVPIKTKDGETIRVALEGLVHVSELSWDKVGDPKKEFAEGQEVDVKVIGKKDGRLALSIKQMQKDPWQAIADKYSKDQKATGKVVRMSEFGAFVALEPGIEGLVHITKIPPDKKLKEGDEVSVYIEEIDTKKKKISLGLILTTKPVGYK